MSSVQRDVAVPPGPRLPRVLQGVAMVAARRRTLGWLRARYGPAFSLDLPLFGPVVVISDPGLVKQVFTASPDAVSNIDRNLGRMLGPGSLFGLDGAEHRRQRKLLVPAFHGERMGVYRTIVEEETLREIRTWPEGEEIATIESMMRITLNAILRAVFGAGGTELDQLRSLIPPWVGLGSKLAVLPLPPIDLGRHGPWGRFRASRGQLDVIIHRLIDRAAADPALEERDDVLALMVQSRYDDGQPMTHDDITDELLTLLTAGHETTATTLAWAVERIRRHPAVLARLAAEAGDDDSEYRQATILEVQRARPVIDLAARQVKAATFRLGEWDIPCGYTVLVGIDLVHADDTVFPDASRFDPDRFVGARAGSYEWIPFGGGTRRCIGAAFANMEMNVVLRTLLRELDFTVTRARDERWRSRGVAFGPGRGGRAVVHRKQPGGHPPAVHGRPGDPAEKASR